MPSKSERQRKFMAAACNNPDFAKKVGIDQKVACDFLKLIKKKRKLSRNTYLKTFYQ